MILQKLESSAITCYGRTLCHSFSTCSYFPFPFPRWSGLLIQDADLNAFGVGQRRASQCPLTSLCLLEWKKVPGRTRFFQKVMRPDRFVRSLQLRLFPTFEALEMRHTCCSYRRGKLKSVAIKKRQIRTQDLYFT